MGEFIFFGSLYSKDLDSTLILLVFAVVMGPLWQTFVSSLSVYVRSSIEGTENPYAGRYDSDGAEKSIDSFVVQVTMIELQHL